MSTFLLVPLEDTVVFPNMNVTLTVDVGNDEQVLLVPRGVDQGDRALLRPRRRCVPPHRV